MACVPELIEAGYDGNDQPQRIAGSALYIQFETTLKLQVHPSARASLVDDFRQFALPVQVSFNV